MSGADVLAVQSGEREKQYLESESDALIGWRARGAEHWESKQREKHSIPSWLNAPDWAEWIQFCSQRGWLFVSEQPHVYSDGVVSVHVGKMKRACEVPGVLFLTNSKRYSGMATPHWVVDRRNALARVAGGAS